MTRHGNRGKVKSRTFPRFPQRLGTRTKRGFPHSHSDGGCGYCKGQCSRTARIAGLSRFSRRTRICKSSPDLFHRLGLRSAALIPIQAKTRTPALNRLAISVSGLYKNFTKSLGGAYGRSASMLLV